MKYFLTLTLLLLTGCNQERTNTGTGLKERVITYQCEGLTDEEKGAFVRAFKAWNKVIGNRFGISEVDGGGMLTINKRLLDIHTLGVSYSGHIEINNLYTFHCGKPYGVNGLEVDLDGLALHEVGHSLGLKHLEMPNCMYEKLHSESHWLHEGDKRAVRELYK